MSLLRFAVVNRHSVVYGLFIDLHDALIYVHCLYDEHDIETYVVPFDPVKYKVVWGCKE